MPLKRQEKVTLAEEYQQQIESGSAFYVFEYRGLSVDQINELRGKIRESGSQMKVVKNRMLKRAIENKPLDGMNDILVGPNAVIFASDDPIAPCKALVDFAKDHEVIQVKAGAIGDDFFDAKGVETLAKIPSQDELMAKILGGIKAPASNLLGLFKGSHQKIHGLITALADKLEKDAA